MFGKLHKLDINDRIYITDLNNKITEYIIYDKYKTKPDDVSCLSYDENRGVELTLITCSITGLERVIIKAQNISNS